MNTLDYTAEAIRRIAPQGTEFRLEYVDNLRCTLQMRDEEMEKLQRATSLSLTANLYIDGREGFFATSHLETSAIDALIKDTVATTLQLQPDDSLQLPSPERYYKGDGIDLLHCDDTLLTDTPQHKIDILRAHHAQLQGRDHIVSRRTVYMDNHHRFTTLASNGFYGKDSFSKAEVTSIVTVDGKDGQHPMEGWSAARLFQSELPENGIADTAYERAIRMIGQHPAPSGKYDMIVESSVADHLLMPVLTALNGVRLHTHTSFMSDWMDKPFASEALSLVDDPLVPHTRGACHFETDGTATRRRTIFDGGRLRTFFIDTPMSIKLSMSPTTEGAHHLIMQEGTLTENEMIRSSRRAIVVTSFNGGNCDPTTGHFSYGIEGLLVEDGHIVHPISGMNISGTMHQLWQQLEQTGCDADPYEVHLLPSLLFRDIDFGGI